MEYVIAGETNLMGAGELSSVDKLRRLFEAFNEKRDILNLLDHSLRADGVQIFIGQESGFRILDDCSVITAPYSADNEVVGRDRRHRPHAHGLRAGHSHRRRDGQDPGRRAWRDADPTREGMPHDGTVLFPTSLEIPEIGAHKAAQALTDNAPTVSDSSRSFDERSEFRPQIGGPDEKTTVLPETAVALVEMERLQQELAASEERAKNHWEQYLRALADVDNVRKRAAKDLESARQFAVEKFAQDLIAVKDSLELAIANAEKAVAKADVASLIEGQNATLRLLDEGIRKSADRRDQSRKAQPSTRNCTKR